MFLLEDEDEYSAIGVAEDSLDSIAIQTPLLIRETVQQLHNRLKPYVDLMLIQAKLQRDKAQLIEVRTKNDPI